MFIPPDLGHPYRVSARAVGDRDEGPAADPRGSRDAGLVGGAFHALRLLALSLGLWATAWSLSDATVRVWGSGQAGGHAELGRGVAVALGAFVLASLAGGVGNDVWNGRRLARCRAACVLLCLLGPVGLVVGVAALVTLSRPHVRDRFG